MSKSDFVPDKLDDIIVEEGKPDFDLLGEVLQPYVKLARDGSIMFEKSYEQLPQWGKILIYLLARKGQVAKKLIDGDENLAPIELSEKTYIPPKSATSILVSELKGIVTNKNSKYSIPNYNLNRCKDVLQKLAKAKS